MHMYYMPLNIDYTCVHIYTYMLLFNSCLLFLYVMYKYYVYAPSYISYYSKDPFINLLSGYLEKVQSNPKPVSLGF